MPAFSSRPVTAAMALVLAGALAAGNAAVAGVETSDRQTVEEPARAGTISAAVTAESAAVAPQSSSKPSAPKRSKAALGKLNTKISAATQRLFERASAAFPSFCQEWERKLRERERRNLSSVKWQDKNGWKIGYYLGYGRVLLCECKHSTRGMPVGKLKYHETNYYLAGRTVAEALHAPPKPVDVTATTELFRWDRNNWAY